MAKGGTSDRIDEGTTTFWVKQTDVDESAKKYSNVENEDDKTCSDFEAGNAQVSNRMNKKCTVSGLIGYNCRHQHPGLYADMKDGGEK